MTAYVVVRLSVNAPRYTRYVRLTAKITRISNFRSAFDIATSPGWAFGRSGAESVARGAQRTDEGTGTRRACVAAERERVFAGLAVASRERRVNLVFRHT